MFTKSIYSHKAGACDRLASQIASAARAMGLHAETTASGVSASRYVYIGATEDAETLLKIRCSDHDDKHGGSDWQAWADSCPSQTIARLAAHYSLPIPAGYSAADYAARSATALAAGAARAAARHATEDQMIAAISARLAGQKARSKVAAGRIVDEVYGALPRAQRQRIAFHAALRVARP